MPDLAAAASRLYRRLIGGHRAARRAPEETDPGITAAAPGAAAIAVVEAALADAAAVDASWPAASAGLRFRAEAEAEGLNLLGRRCDPVAGGLATAVGLAAAGERAAAFVAGPELERRAELLATAAARRLPLVVHLACRAAGGSGDSAGGGHAAVHAAAAAGAVTLVAANVQEAVDLAVAGRRLAEAALLPVVVAADAAETVLTVQDVRLPSARLIERTLGRPGDTVHASSPGQGAVFGRHRRRLPRRHDPARPALTGAPLGPEAFALAAASREALLDAGATALLARALDEVGDHTGRRLPALSEHRVRGAEVVVVAMGSAIEVAEGVADSLAAEGWPKTGVVGIRALCPFPESALVEALSGHRVALVLERTASPLGAEGPLTAAVRCALGRALENGRARKPVHPELPALDDRRVPRLLPVVYGLGGSPLRAADLTALCREADRHAAGRTGEPWPAPRWLGLDLAPHGDRYPKRRALLDRLRRDVPRLATLGMSAAAGNGNGSSSSGSRLLGNGGTGSGSAAGAGLTVAIHRASAGEGEGFAGDAAVLLHRLAGGALRGRTAAAWTRSGAPVVDRLTWTPEAARDPGDEATADLVVWRPAGPPPAAASRAILDGLCRGGVLVVAGSSAEPGLPSPLAEAAAGGRIAVFAAPDPRDGAAHDSDERLLGALFGVLRATGRLDVPPRRLVEAGRELLAGAGLTGERAERRLADLQAGFGRVRRLEAVAGTGDGSAASADRAPTSEPPAAARRAAAMGGDGLAALWDRAGVLYRRGELSDLAAEPVLAAGSQPSAGATLAGPPALRGMLPELDPAACTGCGACWTVCPEGAIVPAVPSAAELIELGMRRARERGRPADPLRMVSGKLAAALGRALAAPTEEPREAAASGSDGRRTAGELFDEAFAGIAGGVPAARREAVAEAFAAVRAELAPLPLARTAPFFDSAEAAAAGSGVPLVLAIDPEACTGCGLCIAACAPAALSAVSDDPARGAAAAAVLELIAELPAPSPAVVERARSHPEAGPLAADLLPASARAVLAGGAGDEPGSGASVAVRQVLGAGAARRAGDRTRLAEQVADLRRRLAAAIHGDLEKALPDADLEALAQGLDAFEQPEADLGELTSRVDRAFEGDRLEVPRLRRLVTAAQALADLALGAAADAADGSVPGAAPFGLLIAGAAPWAGAFPFGAPAVPATFAPAGEAAGIARGLAAGQVRGTLAALRSLRRARLELERPAEAGRAAERIARLAWSDLDAAERRLCPPLVVVAAEGSLGAGEIAELFALLAEDLPVKLLLLAEADLGLAGEGATAAAPDPSAAPGLRGLDPALVAAVALPRATVAQSSIADPEHLASAVGAAFAEAAPALIRVHAPSPLRHGFAADGALERAREAVVSRVFPLFRRQPAVDGAAAPPPVELSGDPADPPSPEAAAVVAWALAERRFARFFSPLAADAPSPLPLGEWLERDAGARAASTPFLAGAGEERLRVAPELAAAAGERCAAWRTLQRLAAVPAPAGEAAAQPSEAAVADGTATDARLAALAGDYEARLARLRAEVEAEAAGRVHRRLLALLTATPAARPAPAADPSAEHRP